MTTQTITGRDPSSTTLSERLVGTPLDPAKGRAREYRVIFALTTLVLVMVLGAARLITFARATGPRRSIVQDAKSIASSALAYAYRH